jgi:surfactin synthase thioesterase subunit
VTFSDETVGDVTGNSVMRGDLTGRWLPYRAQAGAARAALTLYCLPHAGGSASVYRQWLGKLPGVAVQPVQPPGRENRWREPPHERMRPLVSEVADVVAADARERLPQGGPYAVYGHSMGALVAFELLREIRRRGEPGPVHLFVSGCVAPHTPFDDGPPVRDMTRPEVVDTLRRLGGTPEWLLSDPSVLDMIIPATRADFSVKETHTYLPEPPLDVPITAFPSTNDPRASQELVARWREQTTARFELHTLVGGHFAVFEQAALIHRYISEALRQWV